MEDGDCSTAGNKKGTEKSMKKIKKYTKKHEMYPHKSNRGKGVEKGPPLSPLESRPGGRAPGGKKEKEKRRKVHAQKARKEEKTVGENGTTQIIRVSSLSSSGKGPASLKGRG